MTKETGFKAYCSICNNTYWLKFRPTSQSHRGSGNNTPWPTCCNQDMVVDSKPTEAENSLTCNFCESK